VCLDKLVASGLSPDNAAKLLATITGAMVVANALNDIAAYDRATRQLMAARGRKNEAARSRPTLKPATERKRSRRST
jgi:TetR/AcrR family transcriptional repressor of nem operon